MHVRYPVLKTPHVPAHPGAEGFDTQRGLEHAQHGAALRVRDAVKCIRDVVVGAHRLADLTRRCQRVRDHHGERRVEHVRCKTEIREHLVRGLGRHPAGKRLVQPDVVPPPRRHQIAEPLMRQLVRMNAGKASTLGDSRLLAQQQETLPIRDRTHVFHGAGGKIGNRDQIDFRIRHRIVEVALQRRDQPGSIGQRIVHARSLAPRRHSAQRQRGLAHVIRRYRRPLDHVQRADGKGDEVGRQRRRLCETAPHEPGSNRDARDLGCGRDHGVFGTRGHVNLKRRLERRFIEAGKRQPSGRRFELRERVVVAAGSDPVQTLERAVEGRVPLQVQTGGATGPRLRRFQQGDAARVHLSVLCLLANTVLLDAGLVHGQVGAVEPQRALRRSHIHIDRDASPKPISGRIDLEIQHIPARDDIAAQLASRHFRRVGRLDGVRGPRTRGETHRRNQCSQQPAHEPTTQLLGRAAVGVTRVGQPSTAHHPA